MARKTLPLTSTQVKTAKSKEKDYKVFDGGGLYLLVSKSGGKRWRLKYRFNDKEKLFSFRGISKYFIKRSKRKKRRIQIFNCKRYWPYATKKEIKQQKKRLKEKENTFYKVSQEWHKNYESEVSENYHNKLGKALENYIYPFIKNQSIEDVSRLDIIEILQDLKIKE